MLQKQLFVLGICAVFLSILYYLSKKDLHPSVNLDAKVYVDRVESGNVIIRNGKPFKIKGASGNSHLKELAEIGGNTIRLYDTINLGQFLDEAQKYNLAVIVDIPLPRIRNYYNPYILKDTVISMSDRIERTVNKYKSHPALLFWNLGNEIGLNLKMKDYELAKSFNHFLELIHKLDPDHPVGTTISGISKNQTLGIHLLCPEIDLVGYNVFSNLMRIESAQRTLSLFTKPKPYYLSEWGIDGYWETENNMWGVIHELDQKLKSEIIENRFVNFITPNKETLGSLYFYWGYKIEGTPSWFGVFDEFGNVTQPHYTLKKLWKSDLQTEKFPLEYKNIKVDGNVTNDEVIVKINNNTKIEIEMDKIPANSNIGWSLFKEDWANSNWYSKEPLQFGQAKKVDDLNFCFNINIPEKSGPYRVFINIIDIQRNVLNLNIPIYALEPLDINDN